MENQSIVAFLHFSHPTKEQEIVLNAMERFIDENDPYDFLVLCGAAGTGKTSVTRAINEIEKF
jgi:hypothetical protein